MTQFQEISWTEGRTDERTDIIFIGPLEATAGGTKKTNTETKTRQSPCLANLRSLCCKQRRKRTIFKSPQTNKSDARMTCKHFQQENDNFTPRKLLKEKIFGF